MSSKAFHTMGCLQDCGMLQDRLGAATFFLGNPPYPFTVRDSKESEHNHIYAIDVVGGRKTGCRTHPPSAERLEELEKNVSSVG